MLKGLCLWSRGNTNKGYFGIIEVVEVIKGSVWIDLDFN